MEESRWLSELRISFGCLGSLLQQMVVKSSPKERPGNIHQRQHTVRDLLGLRTRASLQLLSG